MIHVIDQAANLLQTVVQDWYTGLSDQLGFGFVAVEDAPSDLDGMSEAFKLSANDGRKYPVLSLHADDTIYGDNITNYQFRYVHDIEHHVFRRLKTTVSDELESGAQFAASVVQRAQHGKLAHGETLATLRSLALADTSGQTLYEEAYGKFPDRQNAFTRYLTTQLVFGNHSYFADAETRMRHIIRQAGPLF